MIPEIHNEGTEIRGHYDWPIPVGRIMFLAFWMFTAPLAFGDGAPLSSCTAEPLIENSVASTNSLKQGVISNAIQVIRNLSFEQASMLLPVNLRGVVLLQDSGNLTIFSGNVPIFIAAKSFVPDSYVKGDMVEVEGVTYPGRFRNHVHASKITKIGTNRVPGPQAVSWNDFVATCMDANWIQVSGVVRRIEPDELDGRYKGVTLSLGGGRLSVRMPKELADELSYADVVRLNGVCFYQYSKAGQIVNPVLVVSDPADIQVRTKGPKDPFELKGRSGRDKKEQRLEDFPGGGSLVHGVVTHAGSGEGFWIRAKDRGMRVSALLDGLLEVGDEVDVYGFHGFGYSAVLEDALVRKVTEGKSPEPVRISQASDAFGHDADLIEIDGDLWEQQSGLDGFRLRLVNGATSFNANLRVTATNEEMRAWQPGSRVRVKGICLVDPHAEIAFASIISPKSFEILLRSPADLVVLKVPSWWSPQHVAMVLGGVIGILLILIAAVVLTFRFRIRRQAIEQMRVEVVLNERNRIAQDLHDDLGANLAEIGMISDLARGRLQEGDPSRSHFDDIFLRTESIVRRLGEIVWAVNPANDTLERFAGYLCKFAQDYLALARIRCRLDLPEVFPAVEINSIQRHHLFLAAKEAIHNAVRHGAPTEIILRIAMQDRKVVVVIQDNGSGYDAAVLLTDFRGRENMRTRLDKVGGAFASASTPGQGTVVTLAVPLNNPARPV